ncbi:TPA: serine protease [Klebsiella pneumoniae]
MLASKMVHKSTTRIECCVPGGTSVGTGFWFFFDANTGNRDDIVPLLVTNKHVVRGATRVRLVINIECENQPHINRETLDIPDGEAAFMMHPDPNVDLCILPVSEWFYEMKNDGIHPQIAMLEESQMLGDQFITPIEDVYMTGYPNGLWDTENNRPITRKGSTASSPLEDWQGRTEFMIDMACYGGSSGSPVYIMNQGSFAYSDTGTAMGERFIFLGILYGGPVLDVQGKIEIVNVPTSDDVVVRTKIGLNLGLVIKAERLKDFKPMLGIGV